MNEQRFDDLSCSCNQGAREQKVSIGPFNDRFYYVSCSSCDKRTKGMWGIQDAIEQWIEGCFWVKPTP